MHGGVRYLEKAFMNLDREQYDLVQEALSERYTVLKVAPYLATQLPIMCPIYKYVVFVFIFIAECAWCRSIHEHACTT